jgi:hypothetical protein
MTGIVAPAPPDGLRPGHLGMLMKGHVITGDLAVTLVDLATRELLQIEPSPDEQDEEWIITSALESAPQDQRDTLATYEKTLLTGMAARLEDIRAAPGAAVSLSMLAEQMPTVLRKTQEQITREVVHRGWVHHLRHDEQTTAGKELAREVCSFQEALGSLVSTQDAAALPPQLLPYTIHFGLVGNDGPPLARFAHVCMRVFTLKFSWPDGTLVGLWAPT